MSDLRTEVLAEEVARVLASDFVDAAIEAVHDAITAEERTAMEDGEEPSLDDIRDAVEAALEDLPVDETAIRDAIERASSIADAIGTKHIEGLP